MARTGRPPKPTILKRLAGNPGKRKLNDNEPQPVAKRPPCPSHLVGEARREWKRMAKQLLELGLLTVVDRAALAAYCQAWSDWVEANKQLAKPCEEGGGMVVVTERGYPKLSPYWTVSQQAVKTMKAFLTEFGMTPSSRTRLSGPEPKKPLGVNELLDAVTDEQ